MRFSLARSWVVLAVVALLVAGVGSAQEYRGRIQGTVSDPSQAVVPGATVTLLNTATGVATVRQTNDTGHYLFDMVEPGTYTISVEFTGFNKFIQEKIQLLSRADVTVDMVLKAGSVQESVTVSTDAGQVQFNTSKLETTVDSSLVSNLPQLYRTPFLLAQLDPSVERNDSNAEYNPYNTWGPQKQRVGGGQEYTNDLQVDGSPVGLGFKTSYVPSPDMVQEVNVQQNAVDAEYGHSAGSAISLTLKSGSNAYHGNAFYQGQYPWANAVENRVYNTINKGRNHMYGGTVGHPILKNKLFNFVAFEGWEKTDPNDLIQTLPTDLERTGDFSKSLNTAGGLRTVYDPFTTQTSADGKTITRTPFPNNVIPASQQDPIAVLYMQKLWKPNRQGIGAYGTNNFYAPLPIKYPYKNFSDRADYVMNEKLRFSGRYSMLRTPVTSTNPTGSDLYVSDRASQRDATSISGDVTWAMSARTVINLHGDWHSFVDASKLPSSTLDAYSFAKLWQSKWYSAIFQDPSIPVQIPRMSINGPDGARLVNMGPGGGYWDQRPDGDSFNIKAAQQRGRHYLKGGFDTRATRATSLLMQTLPGFGFQTDATANTYVNADPRLSGDGYATFLLGAIQPTNNAVNTWDNGNTSMPVVINPSPFNRFFGAYINDDWKLTKNLTLNLGLRYEYEQAYRDPDNRLSRPLDLTSPIPEFQGAGAPKMPAELSQFYNGGWALNGAFQFADSSNPGQWNAGKGVISPRIGMALRLNDKTSFRAGYGRYVTPWTGNALNIYDSPYLGYTNYTGAPAAVLGVPQMRLKDPFPASNPVVPSYGKTLGRYTALGDSMSNLPVADRPRNSSDRINLSLQRALPMGFVLDTTFYLNVTRQVAVSYNVNQIDPRVAYQYKDATNKSVPNPFYNILPVEKFPGQARYQSTVALTSLMRKYPQYGNLTFIDPIRGADLKYYSLQTRLQRSFSKGYSFLLGYNYHYETDQVLYDDIATFMQNYTWQESANPRHRITAAGTWNVPFGKGRSYLANMPRALDAVVGGWDLTSILTWRSGRYLRFGGMVANGNPVLDNPTPGKWFDTSAFTRLPAYTPRTNPLQYDGLTGPGLFNMDASLVKQFHVTEKVRTELRMDVFNVCNNLTWADPSVSITASTFGQSTNQLSNTFGRRTQLGLRVEF